MNAVDTTKNGDATIRRDRLAAEIEAAKEDLDAILRAFDRGDGEAIRYVALVQLPRGLNRVAVELGKAMGDIR